MASNRNTTLVAGAAVAAAAAAAGLYLFRRKRPDPVIIDGKATAMQIRAEIGEMVAEMKDEHGVVPGLAVVLVGSLPESAQYVKNKKVAVKKCGFHSVDVQLPDTATEAEIIAEVDKLVADPTVHGILVQLPLPNGINAYNVTKRIPVEKDADGFDELNVGNMCTQGGKPPLAIACTPAGCIELLQRYNIKVSGKSCVVIGRSNIVGMPVAALLQSLDGTVTVCHSRTRDTKQRCQQADIIIAAVGKPEYVKGDWVKPGAVVIDVGINRVEDASAAKGYRMVGDVAFNEVAPKCSFITPVPGGVGPMTIAMLCMNTFNLANHALGVERVPLRKNPSYVNVNDRPKSAAPASSS